MAKGMRDQLHVADLKIILELKSVHGGSATGAHG